MSGLSRLGNRFRQMMAPKSQLSLPNSETASTEVAKPVNSQEQTAKLAKRPDIYILRLLLTNGPMTSTQIWRTYQRQLKDSRTAGKELEEFFTSKAQLKQKCLKVMRKSERIQSNGYNHRSKQHLGWKVNPEKAFRNLRAPVKQQLRSLEKK